MAFMVANKVPRKGHTLLACSMVCDRSGHLPKNPKLMWHLARLIKEGVCGSVYEYHASKR